MRPASPLRLHHGPLQIYLKPLDGCPDLERFVQTLPSEAPVIWFDSARHHPVTGRWSLLGVEPWLTMVVHGDRMELRTTSATTVERLHPLEALRQVLRRYRAPMSSTPYARAVGLMGFLSYDLNRWIEPLASSPSPEQVVPDMLWFGMQRVVLVDHLQQRSWLFSIVDPHAPSGFARREAADSLCEFETQLMSVTREAVGRSSRSHTAGNRAQVSLLNATSSQAEFEAMVSRALDAIRAGDIYQANVSQRFTTAWCGSPLALYRRLRHINPSPFACFLSCNDFQVVSCSPERLVRVQEGRIDTRPIAGTRPRGTTPEDDTMNSLELLLSEKERAEHIMLVDLARNDLGRVCVTGSVQVNELMALEAYSHVMHIVSDVAGRLARGRDAVDVIRAIFPGGTITGCPKIHCMQLLRALEPVARGLYTGSLGYLGFDGTMDLNIAIRTMVIQGAQLSFHVGAGIVADSDPTREYHETLAKAGALMSALDSLDEQPRHWATPNALLRPVKCEAFPGLNPGNRGAISRGNATQGGGPHGAAGTCGWTGCRPHRGGIAGATPVLAFARKQGGGAPQGWVDAATR